jgi:hypothetical protein
MSDQIPIWATIGQCEEGKVTKKRNVQLVGGKGGQVSASPLLPAKETGGKATPDKFRITHEAMQLLLRKQQQFQHIKQHIQQHYFAATVQPYHNNILEGPGSQDS